MDITTTKLRLPESDEIIFIDQTRPKLLVFWDAQGDLFDFLGPLKARIPELMLGEASTVKAFLTAIDRETWNAVAIVNFRMPRRVPEILLEILSLRAPGLPALAVVQNLSGEDRQLLRQAGATEVFDRRDSRALLGKLSQHLKWQDGSGEESAWSRLALRKVDPAREPIRSQTS